MQWYVRLSCIAVVLGFAFPEPVAAAVLVQQPKFLGTLDVKPEEREEVIRYLHERGFKHTYVPEGAAPDTLLYRSSKSDYEKALESLWQRVAEKRGQELRAQPQPRGMRPAKLQAGKTDEAIFKTFGLSEEKRKELESLQKQVRAATEKMKAMTEGHVEEGLRINRTWREGLQRILTKEQWQQYLDYWQSN